MTKRKRAEQNKGEYLQYVMIIAIYFWLHVWWQMESKQLQEYIVPEIPKQQLSQRLCLHWQKKKSCIKYKDLSEIYECMYSIYA